MPKSVGDPGKASVSGFLVVRPQLSMATKKQHSNAYRKKSSLAKSKCKSSAPEALAPELLAAEEKADYS